MCDILSGVCRPFERQKVDGNPECVKLRSVTATKLMACFRNLGFRHRNAFPSPFWIWSLDTGLDLLAQAQTSATKELIHSIEHGVGLIPRYTPSRYLQSDLGRHAELPVYCLNCSELNSALVVTCVLVFSERTGILQPYLKNVTIHPKTISNMYFSIFLSISMEHGIDTYCDTPEDRMHVCTRVLAVCQCPTIHGYFVCHRNW